MKVTIGIADDHTIFRQGVAEILSHMEGFEVVFDVGDGEQLISKLKSIKPDILLIDIKMPKLDGFDAIKIIKTNFPAIKIIVLSMFDQDNFILHAFQLGVNGYLLKNSDADELEKSLNKVMEDEFYFTENISKILAKGLSKKQQKPQYSTIPLSDREAEILNLICSGFTNSKIGKKLYLSRRTIEGHRKNLLQKVEVKNTAELISWAFRNKLIE